MGRQNLLAWARLGQGAWVLARFLYGTPGSSGPLAESTVPGAPAPELGFHGRQIFSYIDKMV